jgi:hypothetical protein
MATPARETPFDNSWQASDKKDLVSIWTGLRPNLDDQTAERTFREKSLTPAQAGLVFQRWLLEAFRLSGAAGHYAYQVPLKENGMTREEIDGLVFANGQGYLLEAKFWCQKVDFGPIALLNCRVEQRPQGTLGLFFSAFGYTPPALESAELFHPSRVLLFEHKDLVWSLEQKKFMGSMAEMVLRKWRLAVKYGRPNMPVANETTLSFP